VKGKAEKRREDAMKEGQDIGQINYFYTRRTHFSFRIDHDKNLFWVFVVVQPSTRSHEY